MVAVLVIIRFIDFGIYLASKLFFGNYFKLGLLLLFVACFSHAVDYKVIPNSIGVGLESSADSIDAVSGDQVCVGYKLGNPASENVTAKLSAGSPLQYFITGTDPSSVYLPSGTFRYNSTCCLIPMQICFQLPYVFDKASLDSNVFATFVLGKADIPAIATVSTSNGASIHVGSSVAHHLGFKVTPTDTLILSPLSSQCYKFYINYTFNTSGVSGSLASIYDADSVSHLWDYDRFDPNAVKPPIYGPGYCFKASFFTFGGVYDGGLLVDGVEKGHFYVKVLPNYYFIGLIIIVVGGVAYIVYRRVKKHRRHHGI
ncbi:Uncharacterised protein [uncultured archaeon]|nr:Uncharacterised protein [uncultured archaeon]